MERYKGYWITGTAIPGRLIPLLASFGKILKDGRLGSVVEVVRFQDTGIRFDFDLPGWPSFTGWKLAGSPLTIAYPSHR